MKGFIKYVILVCFFNTVSNLPVSGQAHQQEFEYSYAQFTYLYHLIHTNDNQLLHIGSIKNNKEKHTALVQKTNLLGALIWSKLYEDTCSVIPCTGIKTNDQGFIISGSRNHKGFAMKINDSGDSLWSVTLNTLHSSNINAVLEAADGSLYFSGFRNNEAGQSTTSLLFKTDAHGNPIWDHHGIASSHGDILLNNENELFITGGQTHSNTEEAPFHVFACMNNHGEIQYRNESSNTKDGHPFHMIFSSEDEIILGGTNSNFNAHLQKRNTDGEILWNRDYFFNTTAEVNGLCKIQSNLFGLTGCVDKHLLVMTFNSDGDTLKSLIQDNFPIQCGESIVSINGNLYIVGYRGDQFGQRATGYLLILPMENITVGQTQPLAKNTNFPFLIALESGRFRLASNAPCSCIQLFGINGRLIEQIPVQANQREINLVGKGLNHGLYLLRFLNGQQAVSSQKILF